MHNDASIDKNKIAWRWSLGLSAEASDPTGRPVSKSEMTPRRSALLAPPSSSPCFCTTFKLPSLKVKTTHQIQIKPKRWESPQHALWPSGNLGPFTLLGDWALEDAGMYICAQPQAPALWKAEHDQCERHSISSSMNTPNAS